MRCKLEQIENELNSQGYVRLKTYNYETDGVVHWSQVAFYKIPYTGADYVYFKSFSLHRDGTVSEIKGRGTKSYKKLRDGKFIWQSEKFSI